METLRLFPTTYVNFRQCTKDYQTEISEGKTVTIDKGTPINLAVHEISRDPEYYGPDAEEFNPERFDEAKGGFKPYMDKGVLFPFGDGPRMCLGIKFAKAQLKVCIAHILTSFELNVSKKMPETLKYNPWEMMLAYESGILLDLKPITV